MTIIVSLQKAMRNNFKVFFSLDKLHRNGQIDWDEYYGYYMKARLGMEAADLRRMEADPASVGREVREAVAEVRAAWSEAARSNPEASASKSSIRRFVIMEKAPTRDFSWLKAATTAFTFKTQSLNVKLGPRRNYHQGRAAIRHYANQTARPL